MTGSRGSASLEMALGAGLLLVPAVLLVLSFGPWLERYGFVRLASAEAARAVVLSDGDAAAARAVVEDVARGHGIDPAVVAVGVCSEPRPLTAAGGWGCGPLVRGGTVAVVVAVRVPVLSTPFGEIGGIEIRHRRVEPVDLYRSLP